MQAEYVYLDDTPIAVVKANGVSYIETDHLGTPRQVVNPATNQPLWTWDFLGGAFGTDAPNPSPSGGTVYGLNLRFPGQYFDAETGLNYNYFRDYESATGRYVESDPIGLGGGIATYPYVTSEPLRFSDMSGLSPDCCMKAYQSNLFGAYPMGKQPVGGVMVCCDGKATGCVNPFLPNQSVAEKMIIRCIKKHENEHTQQTACTDCGIYAPSPAPWIGKPLAECSASHIEVSCLLTSISECSKDGTAAEACRQALRIRISQIQNYGNVNMSGCFSNE